LFLSIIYLYNLTYIKNKVKMLNYNKLMMWFCGPIQNNLLNLSEIKKKLLDKVDYSIEFSIAIYSFKNEYLKLVFFEYCHVWKMDMPKKVVKIPKTSFKVINSCNIISIKS
jgi:hypothetical protein